MPKYVIERQYLLPVYQRLVVEADTPEAACGEAVERQDWDDAVDDYESARASTITAIKRIPEGIDPAALDFDPDDPATQNTRSLAGFLYGGDASTIHSDVPEPYSKEI
jgi:hypothetical protein